MGNCCAQDERLINGEIPLNLRFDENQRLAMNEIVEEEAKEGKQEYQEVEELQINRIQEQSKLIEEQSIIESHNLLMSHQLQVEPIEFQQLQVNANETDNLLEISSIQQDNDIGEKPKKVAAEPIPPPNGKQISFALPFKATPSEPNEREKKIKEEQERKWWIEYHSQEKMVRNIILIQAWWRGHLSRTDFNLVRGEQKEYLTDKEKAYTPASKAAQPLGSTGAVLNTILQKYIDDVYGKFDPDKSEIKKNRRAENLRKDQDKVTLKPFRFENSKGVYDGEWKAGLRHGYGRFILDNQIYEGYWEENYASGYGRTIFINGDMYEGDYFKDNATGNGVYITRNKTKYEGQFAHNKPHGFGKESWYDGSKFVGTFSMGKKQGEGKFHFRDGSIYEGNFENNMFSGKGKYTWPDGREYEGLWANNVMEGEGTFKWPDGRQYTGQYIRGKKDGNGHFKWPNGEQYQGQWRFGHQHGVGYYTDHVKKNKKGSWRFGKFLGFM